MSLKAAAILVSFYFCSIPAHAQIVCGDCDDNGVPSAILDALRGAQIAALLYTPSPDETCACDVNLSGTVTVLDALVMAQLAASLPVMLGCATPICGGGPSCMIVTPPAVVDGDIQVDTTLLDAMSDPASIALDYSTDAGSTYAVCLPGFGSEPQTGLTTSPTGLMHIFVWDTCSDGVGAFGTQSTILRITMTTASGMSTCATNPFDVDNSLGAFVPGFLFTAAQSGSVGINTLDASGAVVGMALFPLPGASRPNSIMAHPTLDVLYCRDLDSGVYVLNFDRMTGMLTNQPGSPVNVGGFGRHMAITQNGMFFYTGLQFGNTVSAWSVNAAGMIASLGVTVPVGGIMHGMALNEDDSVLYITSRTANNISAYAVDALGGLTPVAGQPFANPSPAGVPDGIVFHGAGRLYTNVIPSPAGADALVGFQRDSAGALTPLAGSPYPGGGTSDYGCCSADIEVSCGYLYISHNATGGIGVFDIEPDGDLVQIPGSPFATSSPPTRFCSHPGSGRLYSVLANGSQVEVLDIDRISGALTPIAGSPFTIAGSSNRDCAPVSR